ncbi:hypothetical protein [Paraburkholderia susongensis]|uniref:hypothetical protein n=1 Tax=Paraburkholderia susongensis TaxID=1515439 RepID=UPI00117CBDE9|nr:hypothetical protein [Paraburkholderia susongensis]
MAGFIGLCNGDSRKDESEKADGRCGRVRLGVLSRASTLSHESRRSVRPAGPGIVMVRKFADRVAVRVAPMVPEIGAAAKRAARRLADKGVTNREPQGNCGGTAGELRGELR